MGRRARGGRRRGVLLTEPTIRELPTPLGPARTHQFTSRWSRQGQAPVSTLVLGHGAGGGVGAPDLVVAAGAALLLGLEVVLVEQPYRVAGRRSTPPTAQLDVAWTAVVEQLRLSGPVVLGGRSSGARVACRTAGALGAAGVLALAFPLVPPRRRVDGSAPPSRQPELDAVPVPVLVVQGEGDPFGMPRGRRAGAPRRVVKLRGNHSLASDRPGLHRAITRWLPAVA